MDTCLPSIVSCTSAFLLAVALIVLVPVGNMACVLSLAADLKTSIRSILENGRMKRRGKSAIVYTVDHQMQ